MKQESKEYKEAKELVKKLNADFKMAAKTINHILKLLAKKVK